MTDGKTSGRGVGGIGINILTTIKLIRYE